MKYPRQPAEVRWLIFAPLIALGAVTVVGCVWAQARQVSEASPPATIRVDFVSPLTPQPTAQHPATVFYDNFDQPGDLRARYFEYSDANGSFVWSANEGYGGRGGAMRCTFEKGQVSAGSLKVLFGRNPFGRGVRQNETFREIYWRVYVKHEVGWQGNPAKLARATCLAGRDWSQGFIAHVWGGKGDVLCIDPATGIRDSRKVTTKYNDFDNLRWLGLQNAQTPIFGTAESGRWVCVESGVYLNSPGQKDGAFALWIDGKLEAIRYNLDWHGAWNDYAINAVFLENYWNQGAVKKQSRWFDEFAISTQRVGPIVTDTTPTFTRTTGTDVAAWEAQVTADASGADVLWTSKTMDGATKTLTVDAEHGTFTGSYSGLRALTGGAMYWLRLRQRLSSGIWSQWTAWHSPFLTTQPPSQPTTQPRYVYRYPHDPNGTGKFYMGREIAQVMGHQAADWLDRPERDVEEQPNKMIAALQLKPTDVVADIGAGSGFITFRLAALVPKGKVYAVDIQPEMLDIIRQRMKDKKIENVEPVLGTITDPNLPPNSVDLILMVDVYHEFSHPYEMTQAMVRALKPGGRLVFVEYRLEDPRVPIKLVHKMSEKQVRREMSVFPSLQWIETLDILPRQHIIIFRKKEQG
ncbi:MAG: class I SAM-dependent methyltransferase [Abditibacteriales bacterium]|nr:class I SAM-dependent methyltransferase [Abditibacteriales bacterium]MDW8368198.1 class I SAM-dependent methyltransferase [Abditibacteriales bacterium]